VSGFDPCAAPAAGGADGRDALERIHRALRLVTVPFPYLAGLAAAARVALDARVPTMGVFASGRMVANAAFVARLSDADLRFVVAHELMHLALRTHQRALGADRMQFNVAHDYIINDLLRAELGVAHVPAGGLDMPGARLRSAEAILLELRRAAPPPDAGGRARVRVWSAAGSAAGRGAPGERCGRGGPPADRAAGARTDDGGTSEPRAADGGDRAADDGDVLADATEREWFGDDATEQRARARAAEEAARRGAELARALGRLPGAVLTQMGLGAGGLCAEVDARRGAWRVPARLALQRGLEAASIGPRTFERPSRRAYAVPDAVLAGRRRDSVLLNLVLDTSGSMTDALPAALGAIADACDALGIDAVRLVQCDAEVARDELLEPHALARMRIDGFGGSDLSPALRRLAQDPTVHAVAVLTDGDVLLPAEPLPFDLTWLLPPHAGPSFHPPQGRVVPLS
jgi:predicted metal-dependent peptidase